MFSVHLRVCTRFRVFYSVVGVGGGMNQAGNDEG